MHMEGKWYLAMSVYILWHLASLNIYSTVFMNHRRCVHCPPEMTRGFSIVVDTYYYTCPGERVQEFPRVDPQKHGLWSQLGQVGGRSLGGSMPPPSAPLQAPSSSSGHALSGFCCFLVSHEGEHPLVWWLACTVSSFASQLLVSFTHFPIRLLAVFYRRVGNFYIQILDPHCLHTWLLSPPGACLFTMFMLSLVTWKILILTQVTSPPHLPPHLVFDVKFGYLNLISETPFTDVIKIVSCAFLQLIFVFVFYIRPVCRASCGWWFDEALILSWSIEGSLPQNHLPWRPHFPRINFPTSARYHTCLQTPRLPNPTLLCGMSITILLS